MTESSFYVHPTAEVSPEASVGAGTRIWRQAHVREGAVIGEQCNIGKGVYVDARVRVGARVKIQNHASLFDGLTLEDGVFVGPHVCFTNDEYPRAITPDGRLKSPEDWTVTKTLVRYGASIGAAAVVVCGITVGEFAMIGAGAVVTRDVPAHGLVLGNPARLRGYVCRCGYPLEEVREREGTRTGFCPRCHESITFGGSPER